MDMELWLLTSGSWLIYRSARSIIYHTEPTTCTLRNGLQRGETATVNDLPDDADPCEYCEPPWPEELADIQKIRYEFPRQSVKQARTPADVITKLTTARDRGGVTNIIWSKPVQDLLDQAAERFPEFGIRNIT